MTNRYVAQQDGDDFYICDLEENKYGEVWVASFKSESEAERYCKFLNKEESK